jgi:hypothetical protein
VATVTAEQVVKEMYAECWRTTWACIALYGEGYTYGVLMMFALMMRRAG